LTSTSTGPPRRQHQEGRTVSRGRGTASGRVAAITRSTGGDRNSTGSNNEPEGVRVMTNRQGRGGIWARAAVVFLAVAMTTVVAIAPVAASPSPASMVRGNMTLWNTLDDANAVATSLVGPGGTMTGGSFTAGRFGGAYTADHTQPFGLSFPASVINH